MQADAQKIAESEKKAAEEKARKEAAEKKAAEEKARKEAAEKKAAEEKAAAETDESPRLASGRLVPRPKQDLEHTSCLLVLVFWVKSRIEFEAPHPWIDHRRSLCR